MEILGIAIGGLLALVGALVGLLAFSKIGFLGLGPMVRSVFTGKFGKIFGIVIFVVCIGGAIAYVGTQPWKGIGGGNLLGSASLTPEDAVVSPAITGLSCVFNSAPTAISALGTADERLSGVNFVADPDDLSHYNAYVMHSNGTRTINGTVSCTRQGDVDKSARMTCYIKGDTFGSETSTSDMNTYNILLLTKSASKVPGMLDAQTAYINDGAIATTSSDREKTEVVFAGGASAEAVEDVGYFLTLPGATVWGYLNNQTSNDVHIFCNYGAGDQEVAKISIVKVSS